LKRYIFGLLAVISFWIIWDLNFSQKNNLREFDPNEIARLDTEMWRSYYEKKPMKLFWQSAELMRTQLGAPFWRSFVIAYHPAKAAFVFKEGKNRREYEMVLPNLEKYYDYVNELSDNPFDSKTTAKQELEWWIIRREREQHPPFEWADLQAKVAAQIYQKPPLLFLEYGKLRTKAMFFRDQKGDNITEKDWNTIRETLNKAWKSLHHSAKMN
jgi:hypothetical protein